MRRRNWTGLPEPIRPIAARLDALQEEKCDESEGFSYLLMLKKP